MTRRDASTMPRFTTSSARSRGVQWVTRRSHSSGSSQATLVIWATSSAVKVGGAPDRGRSAKTSSNKLEKSLVPSSFASASRNRLGASAHRVRQRRTRCRSTWRTLPISSLFMPSAAKRMMRERSTSRAGVSARLRTHRLKSELCLSDRVI